jgi:hypothetical protein
MKTINSVPIVRLALFILAGLIIAVHSTFTKKKPDPVPGNDVMAAFHLRMNGKVDQARTLLEEILKKVSTNAMAYFELSRRCSIIRMFKSHHGDTDYTEMHGEFNVL